MSKLNDLILQYCPDGVEWKTLGEVCEVIKGQGLSKEDKGAGDIPIILYGELYTTYGNYIQRVVSSTSLERIGKAPKILNGDLLLPLSSTTKEAQIGKVSTFNLDTETYLGGDALILRHNQNSGYLTHLMNGSWFEGEKMKCVKGTTINHLDYHKMMKISIPIPPLPVQEEIVRILDCFHSYRIELSDELEIRKGQYEYVKQQLFSSSKHYSKVTLGSSCAIEKGRSPIQKTEPGEYPMVVTTSARKSSSSYQFDQPSVCIPLVSSRGHGVASLNSVYYQEGKFALGNILCAVTPNNPKQVCAKYLYHYLNYMKDLLLVPLMKGGANVSLRIDDLVDVQVPLPPIDEQHRIVVILDKLESFITELLPAEIEARKKQYEHYRDQLLTFKRKEA